MKAEKTAPNVTHMSIDELFGQMTDEQKDGVYRKVWAKRVAEDITSRIEDYYAEEDYKLSDEEVESRVKKAAGRYVYESDYDCNQAYWDNLDALIREIVLPDSERRIA